jgi:hypothetical protein
MHSYLHKKIYPCKEWVLHNLRTIGFVSTITIIILHPFGRIIGIIGGDDWGWGVLNGRWSSFGIGGVLLAHLPFFNGVTEDDNVATVGQPKKPMVEVVEEFSSKILIPQSVKEVIILLRRKIHQWDPLGGPTMFIHWLRCPVRGNVRWGRQ